MTKVECQIVSDKMGFGWRLFPTGKLVGVSDQFDAELLLALKCQQNTGRLAG